MARAKQRASKPAPPAWRAFIHWHDEAVLLDEIPFDEHPVIDRHGWFCVLAAEIPTDTWLAPLESLQLVYIGDAFAQPMRARIVQPRPALERIKAAQPAGKKLIAVFGTPTNRSRKKRDRNYLDGVLRALRERHNCLVAEPYGAAYAGEVVSVVNEGDFYPLKSKVLLRPSDAEEDGSSGSAEAADKATEASPAARPKGVQRRLAIAAPGTSSLRRRRYPNREPGK